MKTKIISVLFALLIPFCVTRAEECDAPKYAKKESKALQKQGWRPFADDGCLAEQLLSKFLMENEFDENYKQKYIWSNVTTDFCLSLDEANKKAIALAQLNLILTYETVTVEAIWDMNTSRKVSHHHIGDYTTDMIFHEDGSSIDTIIVRYKDFKLMETYQRGDNTDIQYQWDNLLRYSDLMPIAKNAWVVLRAYRKTDQGYEVCVSLFNYKPKGN